MSHCGLLCDLPTPGCSALSFAAGVAIDYVRDVKPILQQALL